MYLVASEIGDLNLHMTERITENKVSSSRLEPESLMELLLPPQFLWRGDLPFEGLPPFFSNSAQEVAELIEKAEFIEHNRQEQLI